MFKVNEKIDNREIIYKRAEEIIKLYKFHINEMKKKYSNLSFSISGKEPFCEIWIIGNKIVGNEYDLTMWKEIPILSILPQYSGHIGHYLDVRFNFSKSRSSDDWKLCEEKMKEIIINSLENAIYDFTIQTNNQI